MLTFLLLLATAIFVLYRYYCSVNKKWEQRGIPGPKPEFLFGNLREIWDFDKPRSLVLRDWTKQFGKIYGFFEGQRPFIVVSDFETINEIIVKKFDHFYPRARFALQERKDGPSTRIIEARGPHWKRLRALGSMAFTNKSLRNILSTVEDSATNVVDGMGRHQGEINTLEYFQEYTLDVICKVALGMRDVKMFNNEYLASCRGIFYRPLRHPVTVLPSLFPSVVNEIRGLFFLLCKNPYNYSFQYNISAKLAIVRSPFVVLMEMLKKNVEDRKAQRANGLKSTGDFIDLFLDAEVDVSEVQFGEDSDTARRLSSDEIVGQCLVFLLAGFDTTSNSLAYTTHFLANHDDVQKKLIDEIDSFLIENETIEVERLNELPYMDAVIKESLRHYPLGSTVVTRECAKSCEIGGFKFEIGDQIATDTWSMHMDENVWGKYAKEFRPERWLEESSRPRAAFQSFGEGPRICLGMRLAYIEEKIALIKLLSRFTIEKTTNTNPIKLLGSLTVGPEKVMVKLVKRYSV
ncbi:hypothetical protein PRIPAC_81473 [Pristionchus pacificus]|uniref:Cytochrome P450 n=1 Tax=Pristionchus pacificus TaxID=54126 RepID=A0A454XJ79_PRIPA|nr:hypothetical protein PRIPAC_81473 [Pristionchus pacificus]|eukprot:PDM73010.1 cytochrome P450 [Pristionchus pacificus]